MQPNANSSPNADMRLTSNADIADRQPMIRVPISAQELRLREAEHRIGNSLQLVSTFLALEERRVPDAAAKQVLADTRRRIAIVARLHRQLSTADSVGHLALDDYLQGMSDDLSRALIDGRRVTLLMNVDPLSVPATVARGLGLVINELVSNSLKHAFPLNGEGVIEVACGLDEDGQIALQVSDNGVGYAAHDGADGGLGMKIVEMLLGQMNGHLDTVTMGKRVIHKICLAGA